MNGRERIIRTIERKEVDRPALYYRALPSVTETCRKAYGLKTNAEVPIFLGSDAIQVPVTYKPAASRKTTDTNHYYDHFGNLHHVMKNGDLISDHIISPVLANAESVDDILNYTMPGPEILNLPKSLHMMKKADLLALDDQILYISPLFHPS